MPSLDSVREPYPGLRPFEASDADLFFGRERHVDALLTRLSGSHFVSVIGESGAGKSSLVRAGLLPALNAGFVVEAGSDWRVAVMRPGGTPLSALADSLLSPGVLYRPGEAVHREFALAELRRGPTGLVQLVRDAHLAQHCNTLLVVDQFEELFRYCREPAQKDQANVFVEHLLQATRQRQVPIFVVLTMRSDFVGECARFRGLPEALNDNQYLTPRLTREQIAAAIREPARVCGGTVDQSLVDELCNVVGDDQDQLPLLQHLLMRVWDRAKAQSTPPCLTPALSQEMGGLRCALNNHAQQIYDSLQTDERRAIARALFKSLTDPHSQRRDLRRDALVSEVAAVAAKPVEATIAVADEFRATGRHMLMPPPAVPLDASSRLDISHESLLRQWSRLGEWAREEGASAREFDRLRDAQRERDQPGDLLEGRALARALDWIKQTEPTPAWADRHAPPGELEATLTFIRTSEAHAIRKKNEEQEAARRAEAAKRDEAARRARLYRWITGGALALASVVAIVVTGLWREARGHEEQARKQEEEARNQAQLAHSGRLTAYAQLEIRRERGRDAALAVLLAREAVRGGASGASHDVAIGALREALAAHVPSVEPNPNFRSAKATNYIRVRDESSWLDFALSAASVSSRDDMVITPTGNNAVIWSAASGEIIQTLRGHTGLVGSASFSPDGRLAVTTSADKKALVWDISDLSKPRSLQPLAHREMLNHAVFNRDGTLLVTLGDDATAKIWTVADLTKPRCELERDGNFILASFSRDERLLATVTHLDGEWHGAVWDVAQIGCPKVKVPQLEAINLQWLTFSDGGDWLGAVTVEGEAIVLSVPEPSVLEWKEQARIVPRVRYERRDESGDRPPPLAWSHDGRYVATAWGSTVYLREIATPTRASTVRELRGHTDRVTSMAFNPTDDKLLTTSRDGTARVWAFDVDKRILERLVLNEQEGLGSGVFSPRGDRIVTAGEDGKVRSWKPLFALRDLTVATSPAAVSQISMPELGPAQASRWFVDGMWLSGAIANMLVSRRDDLRMENPSWSFQAPRAVRRTDNGVSVSDPREPRKMQLLAESDRLQVTQLAGASPRGRFLFTSPGREGIKVWDVNASARPEAVAEKDGCVAMTISDDKKLAWYCADRDRVIVEPAVEIPIQDKSRVESMRFSTDGRLLALAMEDYSVRLFDSSTGAPHSAIRSHGRPITGMDFSDDDRFLVSTREDSTARVWELATRTQIAVAATGASELSGAAFSSGGGSLLLFAPDRVLIWRCYACADVPGLLDEVRRRQIVRPLSQDEQERYNLSNADLNADRPTPSPHPNAAREGRR